MDTGDGRWRPKAATKEEPGGGRAGSAEPTRNTAKPTRKIGGTVRDRAAEELRNRILTGALAPGTRLDLDAVCAEFGASRTPIREALLELSYEGLVEVAPRSGITVIGLIPRDVLDNFTILGILAGKAAEWAAARITAEQLDEIRSLADEVTAAAGDTAGRSHQSLVAAFGRHRPSPVSMAGLPVSTTDM